MLKRTTEGYIYISQNTNIQYGLFEGITIGGDKQYTSDIIFVMLVDPNYNVDNNVVGYLFGASFLPNFKNYEESIGLMVNEFEERNGLL